MKEHGLQLAFAVLIAGYGVDNDAATYAHHSLGALYRKCANGHVKYSALLVKKSDSTRVNTTWLLFKLGQQLHGPYFGCACDGSAGKQRAKDVTEPGFRSQISGDGRRHLPE